MSVQARGAVWGGAGLVLVIAGLWRVDGVLAALGLAAWCLLGLAWWVARRNSQGLELIVNGPTKVQAGTVFPLVITMINHRQWLDAFGVGIDLQLAGQSRVGGRAAWVAAGSAADLDLRVTLSERGRAEKHRGRLTSDFPFGFFEVQRLVEVEYPLWVIPKPRMPGGLEFSGGSLDAADGGRVAAGDSPGEPSGLRPWRAGDSPRRIIWPATLRSLAKGAGLIVREVDPPGYRPRRCAVVFHSFGLDGGLIRPDRFERALSLAAGVVRHLQAQGIAVRWVADFEDWEPWTVEQPRQMAAFLDSLAGARRAMGTEAHDLQAALAGLPRDEGLIVLSDMPASGWRFVLTREQESAVTLEIHDRSRRKEVLR